MDIKGQIKSAAIICGGVIDDMNWLVGVLKNFHYIIAADSGYDYCLKAGVKPDIIIGDFDSVNNSLDESAEIITLPPKKDCTDFEFCLEYCHKKGISKVMVFGASGGRPGHSFAAVFAALKFFVKGLDVILITERNKMFFIKDNCILKKSEGYVSIFALREPAIISLEGFEYPLNDFLLQNCDPLGVSNKIVDDYGEIKVSLGVALVIIEN